MDSRLFEETVNEIRPQLVELCERFIVKKKIPIEAEDAVQETLFRLWQIRHRLDDYDSIPALAITIAKNVCIDILRRQHTKVIRLRQIDMEDSQQADQRVITHDTCALINQALDELPFTKRRMIEMRSEGLSLDEISNICNTTKQSTKTMISSARRFLLEKLRKGGLS